MKNHTDLLNLIAIKIKAKAYLEIGVQNSNNNFDKIEVEHKVGIDPDLKSGATFICTSDHFFDPEKFPLTDDLNKFRLINLFKAIESGKFRIFPDQMDLIFCDGLHHADQTRRDILNSWSYLSPGGVIVIHDSNPHSESITHVPRSSKEWTGDVYKTICNIESEKFTIDFDYGCCVLRKGKEPLVIGDQEINWDLFDKHRKQLLNLVSIEEGLKIIDEWI